MPEDVFLASRELAGLFGQGKIPDVPAPFGSLPEPALFRLLGWFGYFSELREGAHLRPAAVNAARGYRAFKRWPASFDGMLIAALEDYVDRAEAASYSLRTRTMAQLMVVVRRAGSPEAITILRERAERVFGVPCDTRVVLQKIYGPVFRPEYQSIASLTGQPCFSFGSTRPTGAMRSNHSRIRSRARWPG